MTIEQYSALVQLMPLLETALGKSGEKVPRPQYDSAVGTSPDRDQNGRVRENLYHAETGPESGRVKARGIEKRKKANIEATSDEDEDE